MKPRSTVPAQLGVKTEVEGTAGAVKPNCFQQYGAMECCVLRRVWCYGTATPGLVQVQRVSLALRLCGKEAQVCHTHKDLDIQARLLHERTAKERAEESQEPRELSPGASEEAEEKSKVGIPHASGIPGLEELLQEYADVFPDDLPAELPIKLEFEMKIPLIQIDYLYSHGMARDSLSEFAAQITLAPKSDGTWWFCTDYMRLNAVTQEAKYLLPLIEDCLDQLGKALYFSKIDLRSGYWQMLVAKEDILKTVFQTPYRHHTWLVMPPRSAKHDPRRAPGAREEGLKSSSLLSESRMDVWIRTLLRLRWYVTGLYLRQCLR
eukprot:784861-Rhodomonas_salina.7